MTLILRQCGRAARALALVRPTTPTRGTNISNYSVPKTSSLPPSIIDLTRRYATAQAKLKGTSVRGKNTIDCACARHPWPEEKKVEAIAKEKPKDCDFDFKKLEVNPYDTPCDCKDPPLARGCADVGQPREVCCRTLRQYGCYCEEEEEGEEESCDDEEEAKVQEMVVKSCDLDFRKLEVNPYDDPCDCRDPAPASSCQTLGLNKNVCCRTRRPFGCYCDEYTEFDGLPCTKQKVPAASEESSKKAKKDKECVKTKYGVKCL